MTSHERIAHRWVATLTGTTTKSMYKRQTSHNLFADGDSIYSYGYHFELARLVRDKKGDPSFFLVNGELYSVSTSRHQATIRTAISGSPLPSVIIPHAALSQAGISLNTVRILEVSKDRLESWTHTQYTFPDGAVWEDHDGPSRILRVAKNSWYSWEVKLMEDGRTQYSKPMSRHWLGESLISGQVDYVARTKCKRCKGTGGVRGERCWDRETGDGCDGAGFTRKNGSRTAKFLSGFDSNETRPSYFLCELPPRSKAVTIEQAYTSLKPEPVLMAEQMNRTVLRQGDIYAMPLASTTKRSLTRAGARFEKRGPLFGTNHVATETAYLPNGVTLVRGIIYHAPQFRQPDHKRLSVGKQWHVVVKNLVPVAA